MNSELDELVESGDIDKYEYNKGDVDQLVLYFPSGKMLTIDITSPYGYLKSTKFLFSLKEDDTIIIDGDLNTLCEKCGRAYCDHENKY
jgi:hypothetical protein